VAQAPARRTGRYRRLRHHWARQAGALLSTVDLVNALEQEKAQGEPASLLRMDLVILDELGYLPFSQAGGACCSTCCPGSTSTPAS
jgi:hypothetical protein